MVPWSKHRANVAQACGRHKPLAHRPQQSRASFRCGTRGSPLVRAGRIFSAVGSRTALRPLRLRSSLISAQVSFCSEREKLHAFFRE